MPIVTAPDARHGGYDARYAPLLRAAEDHHFWFRARNRVIAALLAQVEPRLAPRYRVLEVGCGTGNTLRVLESGCRRGFVVGMDFQRDGLLLADGRVRCPLIQGDIRCAPFGTDVMFDLVGMFDVLEHLDDDVGTLRAIHGLMRPGAVLLLTVPAGPELWSDFDIASGHCRRYAASDLGARLRSAGFCVEYLSPMMAALYPLVWASRIVRERVGRKRALFAAAADELRVVPGLNAVILWALLREIRFVARRKVLPFGSSLVAIAHARAEP